MNNPIVTTVMIVIILIGAGLGLYGIAYDEGEQAGYDLGYDICKGEDLREGLIYHNDGEIARYWYNNGTGRGFDALEKKGDGGLK